MHVRRDIPGFIGNRLQHALKREAIALVAAGVCDAETIDTVVKTGFGARMAVLGPLEQSDLVGLDLTLDISKVLVADLDRSAGPNPFLREKVKAGKLGMKTGEGFRRWTPEQAEEVRERLRRFLAEQARARATRSVEAVKLAVVAQHSSPAKRGPRTLILRCRRPVRRSKFRRMGPRLRGDDAMRRSLYAAPARFSCLRGRDRLDAAAEPVRHREHAVDDLDAGERIVVHAAELAELAGIVDARQRGGEMDRVRIAEPRADMGAEPVFHVCRPRRCARPRARCAGRRASGS